MSLINKFKNRRARLRTEKERALALLSESTYCFAGEEIVFQTRYRVISTTYRHGRGPVVDARRGLNGWKVRLKDGQTFRVNDVQERVFPTFSLDKEWDEDGQGEDVHTFGIMDVLAPTKVKLLEQLEIAQQDYDEVIELNRLPADDLQYRNEETVAYRAQELKRAKDNLSDLDSLADEVLRLRRTFLEAFDYDQSFWIGRCYNRILSDIYMNARFLDWDSQRALDIIRARSEYSESDRSYRRNEWRGVNLADSKYFEPRRQSKYYYDLIIEAKNKLEGVATSS